MNMLPSQSNASAMGVLRCAAVAAPPSPFVPGRNSPSVVQSHWSAGMAPLPATVVIVAPTDGVSLT